MTYGVLQVAMFISTGIVFDLSSKLWDNLINVDQLPCLYVHEGPLMKATSHQTLFRSAIWSLFMPLLRRKLTQDMSEGSSWLHKFLGTILQWCSPAFRPRFGDCHLHEPPQMTPPSDLSFEIIERRVHVFSTVAIYVSHPFSVNPWSFPEIKIGYKKFM